jgi:hypothetical protein
VEFTRNSGSGSVQIGLPVGSHYCTLALGGWNDAASTLASIDGQETHPSATRRPGTLTNGKTYAVLALVRLHGKSVAIEVLVDKEPYLKWSGSENQVSLPGWSHPPYPNRPSLGGGYADVIYHAAWVSVLDPVLNPALLRKKLRGRVTYDARTHVLTLYYDFKNKRQLEDFEGHPTLGNGCMAIPIGEHALHIAKFKTVVVSGVCAMQSPKEGDLISATGGFVAGRHGTTLSVSGQGDGVSNQVGPEDKIVVCPFEFILTHKMAFVMGSEVAKERKEVAVGQVKLLSGLAGVAYGNLTISGEVDMGWAMEFFGNDLEE